MIFTFCGKVKDQRNISLSSSQHEIGTHFQINNTTYYYWRMFLVQRTGTIIGGCFWYNLLLVDFLVQRTIIGGFFGTT